MPWIFYICCIVFSFSAVGQEVLLIGSVQNEKGHALQLSNIRLEGSPIGTVTNEKGEFQLFIPNNTSQKISISHIGYHTYQYQLPITTSHSDTIQFTFVLQERVEKLEGLDLIDGPVRTYPYPSIRILDFAFYQEGFLLLLYDRKRYWIRHVTKENNTIFEVALPRSPEYLFEDCYGNFHIVFLDRVLQLQERQGSYELQPFSMKMFHDQVKLCDIATSEYVYFRRYSHHNQGIRFFQLNRMTQEKREFAVLFDANRFANAEGEMQEIRRLKAISGGVPDIRTLRKIEVREGFYRNILSKKGKHALLPFQHDQMLLCNHISGTIEVCKRNGDKVRSFPINYHLKKGWQEVMVDENLTRLYAKCIRNGVVWLLEIDTQTGGIIAQYALDKHLFPAKLKVKNGVVYYIFKDPGYTTETNLYQQVLD